MGVCYSVQLIKPEVFRLVNDAYAAHDTLDRTAIESLFKQVGRVPSEGLREMLSENDPSDDAWRKFAYDELLTEESVWLDKSLREDRLEAVFRRIPECHVFKACLVDFSGFDLRIEPSVPVLDCGMFAIAGPKVLPLMAAAVDRFRDPADIDDYLKK